MRRFTTGTTDQYIYFVAVDSTDFTTRETGLSSFTVRRSRNGAASAAYTTPTINETDVTNMPGVYELLLDEDMTIDSGNNSEEVCLHITHAGMAPVTLVYELYRPTATEGGTITVSSGVASANVTQFGGSAGTFASGRPEVNASHISGSAVSTSSAQIGVNVVNFGGVAGTFASGRPEVNTTHAAGTAWGSGAITASSIAADAITSAKIADDAITSAKLATGALTSDAFATNAIAASALASDVGNEIADALLDRTAGVETGLTLRQAMRLFVAVLLGKASGLGTTTAVFRDFGDTKNRISATVDADGNRSAVSTDAT